MSTNTSSHRAQLIESAEIICSLTQPNLKSLSLDFDAVQDFSKKTLRIASEDSLFTINGLSAHLISFDIKTFDSKDETRENVELFVHFVNLKSAIEKSVDFLRADELEGGLHYSDDASLNREIEEMRRELIEINGRLRELQQSTKGYDDVTVGAFGLSVPLKAIRNVVNAARGEIEKGGMPNIKFLTSLMKAASSISTTLSGTLRTRHECQAWRNDIS